MRDITTYVLDRLDMPPVPMSVDHVHAIVDAAVRRVLGTQAVFGPIRVDMGNGRVLMCALEEPEQGARA